MTEAPPVDPRFSGRPENWRGGWRRFLFPGLWLVYLLQTVGGVHKHAHGWLVVVGDGLVLLFCVVYLATLTAAWTNRSRWFWTGYLAMVAIYLIETGLARGDSVAMLVFITVLTVSRFKPYAVAAVIGYTAAAVFLPALVPAWHEKVQWAWAATIPLIALAMYGFFGVIRTNVALAAARAEVARLAAENERTRIARDLHDLLGHSLTAITVKAGLARRLSQVGDVDRAGVEIAEVERLARRSLTDVRAAVSGHRDITLAGELATAREVLRAAGVVADLPGSVDVVDPTLSELFGWVVREGVTNVVRHSRAGRCTITLGPGSVEIADDGRGGTAPDGTGSGLTGVRERVAAAGGTVQAGPVPRGWRLRVDVPTPLESRPLGAAPVKGDDCTTEPARRIGT